MNQTIICCMSRIGTTIMALMLAAAIVWPANAEEARPASSAELLLIQYSAGGMVFGGALAPSNALEFALYSDGTILVGAGDRDLNRFPMMYVGTISPLVARQKYEETRVKLNDTSPSHQIGCPVKTKDGVEMCIHDLGSRTVALRDSSTGKFREWSIEGADFWRKKLTVPSNMESLFAVMDWIDSVKSQRLEHWHPDTFIVAAAAGPALPPVSDFSWPADWPTIAGNEQGVCVKRPELSDANDISGLENLRTQNILVNGERLRIAVFDYSIPGLANVRLFRDLGINITCL